MYSETDIDGAVTAGALTPDAARALRDHVSTLRASPAVDEESFRLLTGFNDIFVSIAAVAMLVGVAWIGGRIWAPLAGGLVAATAWGLAEYFTRQRRMALPSIVLLLAFIGGVAGFLSGIIAINGEALESWLKALSSNENVRIGAASVIGATVAAITAFAAWLHWRRFMVPITVAAAAVAVVVVALALIFGLVPAAREAFMPIVLIAGVAMFAFAMRWDLSDPERRTRRSDVAFWLHLAAAPMIAHALFHMLGVLDGDMGVAMALAVVAIYLAFAFVALAVDRRALLVSSLAYVLYAMSSLFGTAGAVELAWALTALLIGSALLTLSAFWQPIRQRVVGTLGSVADRLPPVQALSPRSA